MKYFLFSIIVWILYFTSEITAISQKNLVCVLDSKGFTRKEPSKLTLSNLHVILPFCNYLIYGYAGINPETNHIISLQENFDLDQIDGYYGLITGLKIKYPNLKILLSIGGGYDIENEEKYIRLLENPISRSEFVISALNFVKINRFDGLDLAWQFPRNKPKKIRTKWQKITSAIRRFFGGKPSPVDENALEHRTGFTYLTKRLSTVFRQNGLLLTLTVIPNVNSTLFYDVETISNDFDFITLAAFDFQTPERVPKEADYPSPICEIDNRSPEHNVKYQVEYWLNRKCPAYKLILGIPAFGRAWELTSDSNVTGMPPIQDTKLPESIQNGLLSWPDTCRKLRKIYNISLSNENMPMTVINDPTDCYGNYAYRLPNSNGENGLWIGYEDPETAGNKATFVHANDLGGMAIFDLSLDDFHGICTGDKFPITRAIKYKM